MERMIMHIDMDAFFASIEQRCNPNLYGKPVVVVGNLMHRSVVSSASYEARRYGIRSGMSLKEARQKFAGIIPIQAQLSKYQSASERIWQMLEKYTPDIEIFSVDEAFLDVSSTVTLFGGPYHLGWEIKYRIYQMFGLTCSVGIGPNKLIAKLASELSKPNGLRWIKKDHVKYVLDCLPVEELCGIGEKMKEHLKNLGITTCGQLARYPEKELAARFGKIGRILSLMGKGLLDEPVVSFSTKREIKSVSNSYTLPFDTSDHEIIRETLFMLAEKVARRLRKLGYRGRTVTVVVRDANFITRRSSVTFADYVDDGYIIYQRVLKILEVKRLWVEGDLRMVGINVSNLVRKGSHSLSLLERDVKRALALDTVDKINDKFGEFTLKPARLIRCMEAEDRCLPGSDFYCFKA